MIKRQKRRLKMWAQGPSILYSCYRSTSLYINGMGSMTNYKGNLGKKISQACDAVGFKDTRSMIKSLFRTALGRSYRYSVSTQSTQRPDVDRIRLSATTDYRQQQINRVQLAMSVIRWSNFTIRLSKQKLAFFLSDYQLTAKQTRTPLNTIYKKLA